MKFGETVERAGQVIDGIGVAVTVIGVIWALWRFGAGSIGGFEDPYRRARRDVGHSVLLGLELLVAGDIIRTVAVSPTFTSIGVLAGIVAIRTFLSFTLEMEISSRWPWQSDPDAQAKPSRRPSAT
ncbi:MAG: DUF1622 domain-containing protein [Microthrixaceae bacterium]